MANGYYLSLLVGPVVPVPVPREVLDALVSLTVTSSAGQRGGFQLEFMLNNRSPLHTFFLLAAGQTPLIRVMIIVTVGGIPNVLMDGVMTQTNVGEGEAPGQSTLTVTGEDLTRVMDLQDFTGIPYPAMPPETRVVAIIAKYAMFGMIPGVVPSLFTDTPIPVERIPTHQGTDLEYIQHLASEAGYIFYVDPGPAPGTNTAYWGPEIKVGVPQPALNLDMDGYRNVDTLNFSFDSTGSSLPIVYIQNSLTKIPIPIPIPDINPLQPPLGLVPPIPTSVNVLRDTAKMSPMRALSKGLAAASSSQDSVTADGSLDVVRYGHILRSRGLVGVRGAGLAYDGLYFVKSVTTNLKRGEIRQSFNLSRNALVSITPEVPV
jgi:hypothetical protein